MPRVGTIDITKPTKIETSAGAAIFIYGTYLVLYNAKAVISVIPRLIKKIAMTNFAKELRNFSYILCLVGPLMILLKIKYDIKIKIKSATAEIKKFFIVYLLI